MDGIAELGRKLIVLILAQQRAMGLTVFVMNGAKIR